MIILFILLTVGVVFLFNLYRFFTTKSEVEKKGNATTIKIILTIFILFVTMYVGLVLLFFGGKIDTITRALIFFEVPIIILLIWLKKERKALGIVFVAYTAVTVGTYVYNISYIQQGDELEIKTNVNINTSEYFPHTAGSKIYKLDHKASLQLDENLPVLDGAAAVFPVYSAFVDAVYPNSIKRLGGPFQYNNTKEGYEMLAEKKTDIFFGAYPSEQQIKYAESCGTEFEYTEIGKEAFVFFVNKNNPVESLTTEQIKGIYSGKIKNWILVGGKLQRVEAFQRNTGSGSQSMLIRFMGDTPLMDPPATRINDFMSGIIYQVSDYKNYGGAIGFSFRYYVDTLIANPDIKMISVDGVYPSQENITNGTYPIITPLYAVTYKGNGNENVQKLLDWILSEEGQEIIEKTGYSRVSK